jgi:DNA repair exonuclease SbcCD nuclease subunit
MGFRLGHLADIHVRGLTRHDEIRTVIEAFCKSAREQRVDVIVIAGDLWHSKTSGITPESIELMTWMFREMIAVAPTYVTLGNHDGALTNLTRQDAISPIIEAINDPRLILCKKSGMWMITNGVNLCVYSLFDKESWHKVKPNVGEYNIAVYHGAVAGSVSEDGWVLKADTTVQFFEEQGYNLVILGDIHKQQYLGYKEFDV